jgi:putative ABC transport system ATP-binding protein
MVLNMLQLTGVGKRFGARQVIANVELTLGAGEYVAIIGESGVGKSTLLNLIAGLERAGSGSILFDGAERTQA